MKEQEQESSQEIKVRFRDIKAFEGLSVEGASALEAQTKLLKYRVGQPLATASIMPNHALWVLDGNAGCLLTKKISRNTRADGSGACVGIASILRQKPVKVLRQRQIF